MLERGGTWRPVGRLAWRAVKRRCPRCGAAGIWTSFTKMKPACPHCGMPLDRGESDYFYGAYLLNFVAAELVAIGVFVVALLITWPEPSWNGLLAVTAAMAVIAPLALYPTTKALWLALDLAFRPDQNS
jgi:uncharacterized protein (DUF983 family)